MPLELTSARLRLRAFEPGDRDALCSLAGEHRIADATISVPHPFHLEDADALIARGREESAEYLGLAVVSRQTGELFGYAALHHIDGAHRQAELSFWLGGRHEGQGYMIEAVHLLIDHAFADMGLNRLEAYHMVRNTGSGRLLAKAGFREEGYLRERVWKWGIAEDVRLWSRLRSDGN